MYNLPNEIVTKLSHQKNNRIIEFVNVECDRKEHFDTNSQINDLRSLLNTNLSNSSTLYTTSDTPTYDQVKYLLRFHKTIYHKLKFIEHEIAELRKQRREEINESITTIIDIVEKYNQPDSKFDIQVNISGLKDYLLHDKIDKIDNLIAKHKFYLQMINPILNLNNENNVKEELRSVIEIISRTVDNRTSFFPQHYLQQKFERLFMSPLLQFKSKFEQLVKNFPTADPQSYLQSIFKVVTQVLLELGINRKPFDSTLVLLLIRFLFDTIFDQNELFESDGDDNLKGLSNITFAQFNPPEEFSPQVQDNSTRIIDVFPYDEHFGPAVYMLQDVLFCTNPFDILDCIDRSLFVIEKAASIYNDNKTMVFPFEVTFELFMAVTISSQINNWDNMSTLVETYTPLTGLCPSFEFAKAKIVASAMQFREMVEEENQGGDGMDFGDKVKKGSEIAASKTDAAQAVHAGSIVQLPAIEEFEPNQQFESNDNNVQNNENNVQDDEQINNEVENNENNVQDGEQINNEVENIENNTLISKEKQDLDEKKLNQDIEIDDDSFNHIENDLNNDEEK